MTGGRRRVKNHCPEGECYNRSLLSLCPFTHPHKVRHKQTNPTVQLAKPSSLAADRSSYSSGSARDKDQTSLISPRKLQRHLYTEQLASEKVSYSFFSSWIPSCLIKWMKSCAQGWSWCGRQRRIGPSTPPPPTPPRHIHTKLQYSQKQKGPHIYILIHIGE